MKRTLMPFPPVDEATRNKASKRPGEKISLPPDQDHQTMPMPAKRPKSGDCHLGEGLPSVQCVVEAEAATTSKGNMRQNQHRKDRNERPKSRFHALQKHFHLCPVTVEEFRKFTNIDQLVKALCHELYGKVENYYRHQLNRLYMFFYLMPNLRLAYPLSKVKVLSNCPEGLKQKIFEIPKIPETASNEIKSLQLLARQENKIPTNGNVDRGKNVEPSVSTREDINKNIHSIPQRISADAIASPNTDSVPRPRNTHLENDIQHLRLSEVNIENVPANATETAHSAQNTKPQLTNTRVTILEDRLLDNLPLSLIKKHANVGIKTNNNCLSCNLTYEKFIENSNILELVRETDSAKKEVIVHKMYRQLLRKDESVFSTSFKADGSLVKILLEFKDLCENCKQFIESSPEEELENSKACQTNNLSSMTYNAVGGCASGAQVEHMETGEDRTAQLLQSNTISSAEDERAGRFQQVEHSVLRSVTSTSQNMESAKHQSIEPGAQLIEERPAQQLQPGKPGCDRSPQSVETNATEGRKSQLETKELHKRWPKKFKSRLLRTLCLEQQNLGNTSMPVSLEQFKRTSHYEVPVKMILNDFCEQNQELLAMLENDKDVYDTLVTSYYKMYFTSPSLRNKYPLKIKMCPSGMRNKMHSFVDVKGKKKENVMQKKGLLCEETRLQIKTIAITSPDKRNTKENETETIEMLNSTSASTKYTSLFTENAMADGKSMETLETIEEQDSNSTSTKYTNPQTESAISDGRRIESSVLSCTSQKPSSDTLKSPVVSIESAEKLDLNPDNSTSDNRIIAGKPHSNMEDVENQENVNTLSTLEAEQSSSEVSPQRPRTRKLPAHFLEPIRNRDSSSTIKNATNQKSKLLPTVKSANNIKDVQNPELSVEESRFKKPTSVCIKLPLPKPRTKRLSVVETTKETNKVSSAEEESSHSFQQSDLSITSMTASDNLNKSIKSTPENMECSKHQFIDPGAQLLKAGLAQYRISTVNEMQSGKPACDTASQNMEIEFAEEIKSQLETVILDKRWYATFRSRLLWILFLEQRNLANTSMPVSLEQFKKTSHYEVPVKMILNDFCEQNQDLLAVLENDKAVYDTLVTSYYKMYFTSPLLRNKYPLKIKMCPGGMRSKMTSFVEINGSENNMQKKDFPCEEKLQSKVIVISSSGKRNSIEPPLTIEIHQTEEQPSKIEINDKIVSNSTSLGEEQFRKTVDKSSVVKESSSIIKSPQKSNSITLCEQAAKESLNAIQVPLNEEIPSGLLESPQQPEQSLGTIEKLDSNSVSTKYTNPSTENALTDGKIRRKSVETQEVAKQLDSNVSNKMSINITSEHSATDVSQNPATSSSICVKSHPRLRTRRLSVQLPDNRNKLNSNSVLSTSQRIENSNTDKSHSTKGSQHNENDRIKDLLSFAIKVPQRPRARRLSLLLSEVNKDSSAETSKVVKKINEHEVSVAHSTAETSQSAACKSSCTEDIDLSVGNNSSCQGITRSRKTMDSDGKTKVKDDDLKQRLDQAMKIFFQNFNKNYSLPYMLRVSSGHKQRIVEAILTLDSDTFRTITHIYKGSQLYENDDVFKKIYKYALKTNRIWPKNLFITLEDICLLLKMKSIPVPDAATILMYISPRFLHWSDLRKSTNFIEYVKMYYFNHTYEHLDVNNTANVENACIEYYNRCWSLDDWVGGVPVIAEHLQKLIFVKENPTDIDVELLQEIKTGNTSDNRPASIKQKTADQTTSGQIKPTTQIILPEALPERSESANSIFVIAPEPEDMVSLQLSSSSEDSTPMVVIPKNRPCEVTSIADTAAMEIVDVNTLPTTQADITIFTEQQIDLETQMCQYTDPLHCSIASDNNITNLETQMLHDSKAEDIMFEEDGNASDSSVAFIPKVVKTEDNKLLRNLLFVIDDDDAVQCSRFSDEILDVDNSQNEDIEDSNLPPSQIDFDDYDEPAKQSFPTTTAPKTSGDLLISGNCGAELNVGKGLLSSAVDITETQTQSQSQVMDAVQFIKSLNDNEINRTTPASIPQPLTYMTVDQLEAANYESFCTIPNAQRFPSTLEETVTTATVPIQIPKASLARNKKHSKTKSKETHIKTTTRTDVVPQLTHPLRALPVVAVNNNPCSSYTFKVKQIISAVAAAKQKQMQRIPENLEVFEEIPSDFLPGPTSTQTKPPQQSEPNQHQQQIIPTSPTLQVSRELSSDKTLFNNSSLLRVCDHNYFKTVEKDPKGAKSDTAQERPTRSRSNSPDRPNTDKPLKVTTAIASTISTLTLPPMTKRIILYSNLLEFHYFQKLTPAHVAKYELPTVNYDLPYLEATISCGDLKTRLSFDSFFSLFPQWSSLLRRDFLIILNDVKEFHYSRFSRPLRGADLRNNILHEFITTTSPFCKAQLTYENNNSEYSSCKSMWKTCTCASQLRKPFQPLTKAIQPDILKRLKTLKSDLKTSRHFSN